MSFIKNWLPLWRRKLKSIAPKPDTTPMRIPRKIHRHIHLIRTGEKDGIIFLMVGIIFSISQDHWKEKGW
jgi:hypothetical protein